MASAPFDGLLMAKRWSSLNEFACGRCLLCICHANMGNIPVTASHSWPVLASVAQALLPVHDAWNASAMAQAGVPVLLTTCS